MYINTSWKLYGGSLRANIDTDERYSDKKLLEALDYVGYFKYL